MFKGERRDIQELNAKITSETQERIPAMNISELKEGHWAFTIIWEIPDAALHYLLPFFSISSGA